MKPITAKLQFLKAVMADPGLSAPAKCVIAALLLNHHNALTGLCNPGLTKIAKGVGRDRRNIIPVVEELKHSGWVEVVSTKGGSPHNSNQYKFDFSRVSTGDENDTGTGDEDDAPPVTNTVATGDENAPRTFSNPSRPSGAREGGEADPRRRAPDGAPPEEEEAWNEFAQLWARGHCDDPAEVRRAFALAVAAHGAEAILTSARAWAAAREPHFLPEPLKWLRDGWHRAPSSRTARRGGRRSATDEMLRWGRS